MPSRARRVLRLALRVIGGLVLVAVVAALGLYLHLRHPLPAGGVAGPEADALAHAVERAVHVDAWERTGAVRWTWGRGKRVHEHLWDRRRQLDRVRWDDLEVLLDLDRHRGRVTRAGAVITGPEADALATRAWALRADDSFWLNPT